MATTQTITHSVKKVPKIKETTKAPKVKETTKAPKVKDTKAPKVKETKAPKVKEVKETKAPKVKEVKAPKVKEVKEVKEVKAPKVKDTKAPKVKETTKAPVKKTPSVVAPVVAPVVVEEPEPSNTPYVDEFSGLMKDLDSAMHTIKDLRSRLGKFEKSVHQDVKATNKKLKKFNGRKRRVVDPNAPPSGFAKPGPVSKELQVFLGLKGDELISRTQVAQRINQYCKDHGLKEAADGRNINPDSPLKTLLNIPEGKTLTFFNLQTYMKVHFPNKEGVFPVA